LLRFFIHVGHTDFGLKTQVPVLYEPYPIPLNPVPLLRKHLPALKKFRSLCLLTTSQFLHALPPAQQFLESQHFRILTGMHPRAGTRGQVLGCDYTAALECEKEAECFLFIGSGKFHPLGLALLTEKPVLSLDIETKRLVDFQSEKKRLQKIRAYHRAQAQEAENFGILLTTKQGQGSRMLAEQIQSKLRHKQKKAWILVMDEVTPSKLLGMKLDALVNCACPRLNEDVSLFRKPMLTPADIDAL
jgi:2-(3-amino-3-carboxypropyl)histidine synthase